MDEKDYELLHALDETRNITHAADKLYMTQSALSKRIKALEQELGVEIVLRSRQGIRFTPAGEQVLLHSAAAAREMEKMRRQLASIQGEACGTLRAGISVNFSYYRLPEVLTEYHRAYPKVRLDIATGHSRNIYQQMLDLSLDVAVLRGEYPWDGTSSCSHRKTSASSAVRRTRTVPSPTTSISTTAATPPSAPRWPAGATRTV